MAAILPHLAQPDEASEIERAYNDCVTSLYGPGFGESAESCPSPQQVLADAHAGLLTMTFVRDAVYNGLQGKQFDVQLGNVKGKDTNKVYLVLNEPIGPGPAWNPSTDPTIRQYKLLSWTSKMNAPSWSLPAGAPQIGGSCPGAVAGQSIAPEGARRANAELVNIGLGRPVDAPVNLAQSICEHCYATGGQYSTGNVQFAQILRYLWAKQALGVPVQLTDGSESTAFIETMVFAINAANYKLTGGKADDTEEGEPVQQDLPPEATGRRFFRIHDSGDFFDREYFRQWKLIADRLPDITFWAPTRIWATSWGVDAVNTINADPRNFIIRPSAYETNEAGPVDLGHDYVLREDEDANQSHWERAPDGEGTPMNGWAAPTTVIAVKQNLGMDPEREQYASAIEQTTIQAQLRQPGLTPMKRSQLEKKLAHSQPRSGTDQRYTWDCRAYATNDQGHTCRKAVAPPGLGGPDGKGCRACWLAPREIVNYSLH